jgi:hypothetical protein
LLDDDSAEPDDGSVPTSPHRLAEPQPTSETHPTPPPALPDHLRIDTTGLTQSQVEDLEDYYSSLAFLAGKPLGSSRYG